MNGTDGYNTGNLNKYTTKNPLKRKMVSRLNDRVLGVLRKWITAESGNGKAMRILDAGCGEGFITSLVHESFPNAEVVGLEYTEEAIQIARQHCPDIHFEQGSIYELPFPDNSFDIVLCTEVLEHLEDPDLAIREMDRVSGKHILVTVPNEPWFCMGNLLALHNVSRLGNPVDHINHWTKPSFEKKIRQKLPYSIETGSCFPWTMAAVTK